MLDPLSITTGTVALVKTAFSLCQTIYEAVDRIIEAPKHLRAVSYDLKGFYTVLGTLDGYLHDEDMVLGVLHPSTSEDLGAVLTNSLSIFKELQVIINAFLKEFTVVADKNANEESAKWPLRRDKSVKPKVDVSKWNSIRSTWREKEIGILREHLAAHKITLNVAIAMTNLINTSATRASTQRIEEDVRQLKDNLTLLLVRLDKAENRSEERGIILDNYNVTIRRFARGADSIITASTIERPPSPSAIVSFTLLSVGSGSTYETAPASQQGPVLQSICSASTYETALSTLTYQENTCQNRTAVARDSDDTNAQSIVTVCATRDDNSNMSTATLRSAAKRITTSQIFVKGLQAHTVVISDIDNSWLVSHVLSRLQDITGASPSHISLSFNGRILIPDRSIADCKIPTNSTLHANITARGERDWREEIWMADWASMDSSSSASWTDTLSYRGKHSLRWYGRQEEATRKRYITVLKESALFWRQKDLG